MASVNRVILIGNLGRDPEVHYASSGDAICNITVATTESWTDKQSGEKREATEWHRIVFYRKLAEIAGKYLKKGSSVFVAGKLRTRKWTDKEGQDRYTTEIEANEMQMLGRRPNDDNPTPEQQIARQNAHAMAQPGGMPKAGGFNDFEDDIPF